MMVDFSKIADRVKDVDKIKILVNHSDLSTTDSYRKDTSIEEIGELFNIDMNEFLEGPNAILFGSSLLEPIKIISEYAKKHDKLDIRVGIISGDVASLDVIKDYASIPSREGLLTMLAGGMIQYVRDLAIGLNLYAEKLEGKE